MRIGNIGCANSETISTDPDSDNESAGRRQKPAPGTVESGSRLIIPPLAGREIVRVRFGVSVSSGTAFPHRRDLDKLAELVRIIDGSGVELIGTNDTSFIGGDAYVRATLIAQTATNARVGIHPTNPLTREPQIMANPRGRSRSEVVIRW